MFTWQQLTALPKLVEKNYCILNANGHDITLKSQLTGHEWIIITNFSNGRCRVRHRHSCLVPFHEQRGQYDSMEGALAYIEIHDEWFATKECLRKEYVASRRKAI